MMIQYLIAGEVVVLGLMCCARPGSGKGIGMPGAMIGTAIMILAWPIISFMAILALMRRD